MAAEQVEISPQEVDNGADAPGFWGTCWSGVKTCASYVAVPFVVAGRAAVRAPSAVKVFINDHPAAFRRYTAGYEFVAACANSIGVAAVFDALFDTTEETKLLGVTLKSFIAASVITFLSGVCASLTHSYTNERYAEEEKVKAKKEDNADQSIGFFRWLYIIAITGGDYLDHTLSDVSSMVNFLLLVMRTATPFQIKRILFTLVLLFSAVGSIKECGPCVKNVVNYFRGREDEAEDVKAGLLTVYSMIWGGIVALINGYSSAIVFDALTGAAPAILGVSGLGVFFWILFGVGPAVASTFVHFLQQMAYDQHAGFTHEDDALNARGKALLVLLNFFDYVYHMLDYATTPIQLAAQNITQPHLKGLATLGITVSAGVACISETGICREEAANGLGKFGLFRNRYEPTRTTPILNLHEEYISDSEDRVFTLV